MVEIGFGDPEGRPSVQEQWLYFGELFYLDSFLSSAPIEVIRGLIELFFGEHVFNSLIFILNGGYWGWSSE